MNIPTYVCKPCTSKVLVIVHPVPEPCPADKGPWANCEWCCVPVKEETDGDWDGERYVWCGSFVDYTGHGNCVESDNGRHLGERVYSPY